MSLSLYRRILRVARTCASTATRRLLCSSKSEVINGAWPPHLLAHCASPTYLFDTVGQGGHVEQNWIRAEARRRFEENRALMEPAAIEEAVQQGHDQVDVMLHYKICYPRPQYADPGTIGGDRDFRRQSSRANTRHGRLHKSKVQNQFRPGGR